jgi:glycosyltransferase involved in cell wall biosynthesis
LDHWILTARAHQAVRSGATLIQEVGASFDPWLDMLVPWKHYVPFHDRDSLKEAIRYLGQDLPNARNLGIQAREVYRRRFTLQNFVGLMDQQ